jgi:hypothetical protein
MYYRTKSKLYHKLPKLILMGAMALIGLCGLTMMMCVGGTLLLTGAVDLSDIRLPSVEVNLGSEDQQPGSSDVEITVDEQTMDEVRGLAETIGGAIITEAVGD